MRRYIYGDEAFKEELCASVVGEESVTVHVDQFTLVRHDGAVRGARDVGDI